MSDETHGPVEWQEFGAASIDGVGVLDGDEYVYTNRPFADIYGYDDPDELVGTTWQDRYEPDERERIETEVLPQVHEKGHWRGESIGRRRDGDTVPLELSLRATGNELIVCVVRDNSPQKRSKDELSEEQQLLREVVDTLDDVLYVIDEDGNSHFWNEALAETTGYTHAEIEAIEPKQFIPEEEREYVPGLAEAIDAIGDQQVDLDILTKDGERIPHEFRGSTFEDPETGNCFRCGVARDIRDRLERERELERYETLIDTVDDGIYSLDEDLRFSFVNDALCEMVGRSREDLLGTPASEFLGDGERALADEMRERVVSGDTDIGSVEGMIMTPDGDTVHLEARYRLYPEPDGEYRGSVGVIRDVTERVEREQELRTARQFNEELVENAPFGMFRLDEDLRITYENSRAEEIIGLPDDKEASDAIGTKIHELPPIIETGQADLFTRLKEGEPIEFDFPFESIYGKEAYFTGRSVPLYRDGEFDGAILMATDISERRQQERQLEQQRDELETLNRINDLLLEITRELLEGRTRKQIERTVCERLAGSELYQFAWIGELEGDGSQLVARVSAGVDDDYAEVVTVTADETETGQGPGGRALRTGEVQVSQNIRTDPTFEPWREAALDRGIQSAAAVPLLHGGTTYGCLAVYTTRPLGFSQREQAAFKILGKAVGFAIHAIETRRLLFADAVLELEFRLADADQFLIRHTERFECELSVEGYVATKSGGWLLYVDVQGASPAAVCEAANDLDDPERVRVVRDSGDEGLVEYRFGESPLLGSLAEAGVKLRSAVADGGTGRLVVEAPQDADVRELADRVRDVYPDAELVAQRERDRSVVEFDVPGGPIETLTDRQREALETAYHAGYFEWPRESTAQEVAESMGIAAPTLNRHFRRAQKQLLSAFFDPAENTIQRTR
jgi:PAS domain S-box-containing protein